jgi:hypothetical protein
MERDASRWDVWLGRLPLIVLVVALAAVTVVVVLTTGSSVKPSPSSSPASVQTIPPPSSRTVSFTGPSYDPELVTKPTRDPVQSRVWFHSGAWWAVLLGGGSAGAATEHHIFRLDPAARQWIDTGTLVDERPSAHVDVLDVGDHIFVASAGAGTGPRNALRIYEFDYVDAAGRYAIGAGVPLTISTTGMRSAVLAQDGSGRLWVAGIVDGKVVVTHSVRGSVGWSALQPPGPSSSSGSADQAAIVAIGDALAVAWTDADTNTLIVARHSAADPGEAWSEIPIRLEDGVGLNGELSAIAVAGRAGERLLVTAQAKYPPGQATGESADIVIVSVEADGSWRPHILSRIGDHQSHPRILEDLDGKTMYAIVTAATQAKGTGIFVKQSPLEPLSFPMTPGAPLVVLDQPVQVDFASTTSQPIDRSHGLVAIAADPAGSYASGFIELGSAFPTPSTLEPASAPQTIARDTFEDWNAGTSLDALWTPPARDTGTSKVEKATGGRGLVARLTVGADGGRMRACRYIPPVAEGTVRFGVRLRFSALGDSDGTVAIRAGARDVANVRFEERGTLAYFNGVNLVHTAVRYRAATWYRSLIVANAANSTYTWGLLDPGGHTVIRVTGLRFPAPVSDALSAVCLETPSGRPGLAVEFDDVLVQH